MHLLKIQLLKIQLLKKKKQLKIQLLKKKKTTKDTNDIKSEPLTQIQEEELAKILSVQSGTNLTPEQYNLLETLKMQLGLQKVASLIDLTSTELNNMYYDGTNIGINVMDPKSTVDIAGTVNVSGVAVLGPTTVAGSANINGDTVISGNLSVGGSITGGLLNTVDNTDFDDNDIDPASYVAAGKGPGVYTELRLVTFVNGYPQIIKNDAPKLAATDTEQCGSDIGAPEVCIVQTNVAISKDGTSIIRQLINSQYNIWYRTGDIIQNTWGLGTSLAHDSMNGNTFIPSLSDITIAASMNNNTIRTTFNDDYVFLILWTQNAGQIDPQPKIIFDYVSIYLKYNGYNPNVRYYLGTELDSKNLANYDPKNPITDNRMATFHISLPPGKFIYTYKMNDVVPKLFKNSGTSMLSYNIDAGICAMFLGNNKYINALDTTLTLHNITYNLNIKTNPDFHKVYQPNEHDSSTTLQVGPVNYMGPKGTLIHQPASTHQLAFSSFKDVAENVIGAKIAAVNYASASNADDVRDKQITDLVFYTNSDMTGTNKDSTSERMRISANGNVGIGTTQPNKNALLTIGEIDVGTGLHNTLVGGTIISHTGVSKPSLTGTTDFSSTLVVNAPNTHSPNDGGSIALGGRDAISSKQATFGRISGVMALSNIETFADDIDAPMDDIPDLIIPDMDDPPKAVPAPVEVVKSNNDSITGAVGDLTFEVLKNDALVEGMRLSHKGYLGLGTQTPQAYLHIKAGTKPGIDLTGTSKFNGNFSIDGDVDISGPVNMNSLQFNGSKINSSDSITISTNSQVNLGNYTGNNYININNKGKISYVGNNTAGNLAGINMIVDSSTVEEYEPTAYIELGPGRYEEHKCYKNGNNGPSIVMSTDAYDGTCVLTTTVDPSSKVNQIIYITSGVLAAQIYTRIMDIDKTWTPFQSISIPLVNNHLKKAEESPNYYISFGVGVYYEIKNYEIYRGINPIITADGNFSAILTTIISPGENNTPSPTVFQYLCITTSHPTHSNLIGKTFTRTGMGSSTANTNYDDSNSINGWSPFVSQANPSIIDTSANEDFLPDTYLKLGIGEYKEKKTYKTGPTGPILTANGASGVAVLTTTVFDATITGANYQTLFCITGTFANRIFSRIQNDNKSWSDFDIYLKPGDDIACGTVMATANLQASGVLIIGNTQISETDLQQIRQKCGLDSTKINQEIAFVRIFDGPNLSGNESAFTFGSYQNFMPRTKIQFKNGSMIVPAGVLITLYENRTFNDDTTLDPHVGGSDYSGLALSGKGWKNGIGACWRDLGDAGCPGGRGPFAQQFTAGIYNNLTNILNTWYTVSSFIISVDTSTIN